MGALIDGKWHDTWYDTKSTNGKFVRAQSQFRNWITPDGSPGPTGNGGFKAEAGRYHLYVSYACPWAHRTLIFRQLKKLETYIGVSVCDYLMADEGWVGFKELGSSPSGENDIERLYELYTQVDPNYSGRVTVPTLWDKQTQTIVSNESSEIIRMFNSAFNELTGDAQDFYPAEHSAEIDAINEDVYNHINNGVYKCGFATAQAAYEEAFHALFDALGRMEEHLEERRYLIGDMITEADWRLFTTLVRFDAVYVGHFKCNKKRIADYPNLSNYLRELYQIEGVAETVNMHHIKHHYYESHNTINPSAVVPLGPDLDLDKPHDRDRFWR